MTNKVKGSNQRYQSVAASLRLLRTFLQTDQEGNEWWWQVEDLASSAKISPRTCYRLLRLLRQEGIPIKKRFHKKEAFWRLEEDDLIYYLRQPLYQRGIHC